MINIEQNLSPTQIAYREYLQSDEWREIRQREILRAGGRCEMCGSPWNLEVHHTNYYESEYLVLCHKCHKEVHYKEDKAEREKHNQELVDRYIQVFGYGGANDLDYDVIKRRQNELFGSIECSLLIHDKINELQIEECWEMFSKGFMPMAVHRIKGISLAKARREYQLWKEETQND